MSAPEGDRTPPDAGACGEPPGGTGSGVRQALRAEVDAAVGRRGGRPVRVLDVGGGSGAWAVPMATAGCQVTVVDTSPNALAALRGRARECGVAERVSAVQGDVQALADAVPAGEADLVLGHGLLEVVDDVALAVRQLAEATSAGGALSLLVAGRHGAMLALAHAGRLAEARAVLADPAGRTGPRDPLQRRLDVAGLRELLEPGAGLAVELIQGDGVLDGWLPAGAGESAGDDGAELRSLVAGTPELLVLASRLHVVARRPGPG